MNNLGNLDVKWNFLERLQNGEHVTTVYKVHIEEVPEYIMYNLVGGKTASKFTRSSQDYIVSDVVNIWDTLRQETGQLYCSLEWELANQFLNLRLT